MQFLLKTFQALLFIVIISVVLVIGGGIGIYIFYSRDLPKIESLTDYRPPIVSEVYANDGTKIGEFWLEKRYVLKPEEMPQTIVQAIVASEDDRFFKHKGIDFYGIFRALIENIIAGHVVQGGSTITQQVTKSLLLTNERKISRKIKEAILATRIEGKLTKDEILYLYLNQIFLGNRAYGIEAAARNYFHKTAKELNIAEAAMIAGLAKAPSSYSPISNFPAAKQRQEYVIERMEKVGYITSEQADQARRYPLRLYQAETDKEFNARYAPWFTEYIRREIQKNYGEQAPYTEGLQIYTTLDLNLQHIADSAVMRGLLELDHRQGFMGPVHNLPTLEDREKFLENNHLRLIRDELKDEGWIRIPKIDDLLRRATPVRAGKLYEAVIEKIESDGGLNVAVGNIRASIRASDAAWSKRRNTYAPKTYTGTLHEGDVVWVKRKELGAEDIKKGYKEGETYFTLEQMPAAEGALFSYEYDTGFVRAIVGGKDFKKSEFNRAIQSVRQPGSVFKPFIYAAGLDKRFKTDSVIMDAPISIQYSPGKFWSPKNYGNDYHGPTTFRNALVNSRNVVTVKILMAIGIDFATAFTRKMGITTPIERYYSMALGSNGMKLIEVCRAYGTIPNGGILPELVFIKRMTNREGKLLQEYKPRNIIPYTQQTNEKPKDAKMGFNQALLAEGEKEIQAEHLKLSDAEKKILYGDYIPQGYTLNPKTAYTMLSIMQDIVNFGTGYKVKELKRPAAGKTGTTNDETDTWFVGFTPELFAGIWVGYDQVKKIGYKETGGSTAAPIFLYYMQEALKGKEVKPFNMPKDLDSLTLPPIEGLNEGDATDAEVRDTPNSSKGSGADFFTEDF